MTKEDTNSKVYNDFAGYGSLKQTPADAKEVDPSIKLDDVRQWMEDNAKRKKQLPGQSSCIGRGLIMSTN